MQYDKQSYLNKVDRQGVAALIPARGGSKGVHKKNIQLIKGFPLIAYSIAACRMSDKIERVIVSTDSEEIAGIARSFGAEVPFLRPEEYASDQSGDIEFVWHFIQYMYEKEERIPEYLVHIRPTTPFREAEIVDQAIEKCMAHGECSSLRSAHEASESPYKWFLLKENGCFGTLNSRISNDGANQARQDFSAVYIPDGYVDVLKSTFVIENQKLHGEHMLGFVSPACTEIDTWEDFDYIRFLIDTRGSGIYDYLKEHYAPEARAAGTAVKEERV